MINLSKSSRKSIIRLRNLNRLTREGVEHSSYISGILLVKHTSREILKKNKKGRVYVFRTRNGRRRRHRASAPGQTHANFSGRLRRSLQFKVSGMQFSFGYGAERNDAPEYAEFVEFGTSRMESRPSLKNSLKSQNRNIRRNYIREIGKRTGAKVSLR